MSETETLLRASIELAKASPDLRRHVHQLTAENARLRSQLADRAQFDLSADSTPMLLRKQAG